MGRAAVWRKHRVKGDSHEGYSPRLRGKEKPLHAATKISRHPLHGALANPAKHFAIDLLDAFRPLAFRIMRNLIHRNSVRTLNVRI